MIVAPTARMWVRPNDERVEYECSWRIATLQASSRSYFGMILYLSRGCGSVSQQPSTQRCCNSVNGFERGRYVAEAAIELLDPWFEVYNSTGVGGSNAKTKILSLSNNSYARRVRLPLTDR